jgi:uridine kinase
MQIKCDILKYELDELEELLFRNNEKIASAKLMLEEWRKVCKEVQDEFIEPMMKTNDYISWFITSRAMMMSI